MKITKRQLRRIIKEAINEVGIAPGVRQSLTSKLYEAIIGVLSKSLEMSATELVDTVNQMHPSIDAELIHDFIDELTDDGELVYDIATDKLRLSS